MGPLVPSVVDFRQVKKIQQQKEQEALEELEIETKSQHTLRYTIEYLKELRTTGITPPDAVMELKEIFVPITNFNDPQRCSIPIHLIDNQKQQTLRWQRTSQQSNTGRPVCLDYLKGKCNSKRWKCKYAHPALPCSALDDSDDLCDVWMLTGFCKFGDMCRNYHPPLDESLLGIPIAPPITQKYKDSQNMKTNRRHQCFYRDDSEPYKEQTDLVSTVKAQLLSTLPDFAITPASSLQRFFQTSNDLNESSSSHTPSSINCDKSLRKVNGVLNRLTVEKFEFCVQQLHELMSSPDGTTLQRVLPMVFAKAVTEEKLCQLYTRLLRRFYFFADPSDQPAMSSHLMSLIRRLLFGIDSIMSQVSDDEQQQAKIKVKRLGNMQFLGEIFMEELVSLQDVVDTLESLFELISTVIAEEAAFHCQLACKLLITAGKRMDTLFPQLTTQYIDTLKELVNEHSTYTQVHFLNLVELRKSNWITRKEEKQRNRNSVDDYSLTSNLSSNNSYYDHHYYSNNNNHYVWQQTEQYYNAYYPPAGYIQKS